MRYAAIDIGSNAIRLLIADIVESPSYKKTLFIRIPLRLGDDAFLNKKISNEKVKDLVRTMNAFKYLMKVFKVERYSACATSAMREAQNGSEIIQKITKKTAINLEIIGGKREASIIYGIHAEERLQKKKNYLYIDVGGGSTQLSFFAAGEMIASNSFNIGTLRILGNQNIDDQWVAVRKWINEMSANYNDCIGIGTGGNINKLYQLAGKKSDKALDYEDLNRLNTHLSSYSLEDRVKILGLNRDRADVIIPASEIYLQVMKWANIKQIYVPRLGLVDGLIQQLIEKNG